jgi:hypothetical protein
MNPFADYIKLLKQGVKNTDKIVEGISMKTLKEFNLLNDEDKHTISDRMDKCIDCPYNSRNAKVSTEYLALYNKPYTTGRADFHCSLCGCLIELKTASLSSNCGIETWNERNPTKEMELKWTKKH